MTSKYEDALMASIEAYWCLHYHSPSYRDLLAATGMKSLSHLKLLLADLEKRGVITLPPKGQTRGVVPTWVRDALRNAESAFSADDRNI